MDSNTIICRCEEVSLQTILDAEQDLEVRDARSAKLMTRCGMGMCQGRICSRNIFDLLNSSDSDRINGSYRPIISPITLGELAVEGLL
jgi:NAD(P)H-nitrite reductase large subunit